MGIRKYSVYSVLLLSMILWSFSYVWLKVTFKYLEPVAVTFIRLIIASIFLFLLGWATGKLQKIQKKDVGKFLLLAMFEPFAYYFGESYGVKFVSPTVAAIVISIIPLVLPFSMYLLAGEKIQGRHLAGVAVSFTGVILVVSQNEGGVTASVTGLLCLLAAVMSVAGYSYLLQGLVKTYNPFTIIAAQNFIAIFYFLPFFLLMEYDNTLSAAWNTELILNLVYLAVFASALAFFFFTIAIKHIGVTKATTFTYFIPVFTAMLSRLYFGENFGIIKIAGIAIVVSGLFVAHSRKAN